MPDTFRCSASSAADGEPLGGTAPTETEWLFVEQPGSWGAKAAAASGVATEVAARLGRPHARLQLIRRPGRDSPPSPGAIAVFAATLAGNVVVRSVRLDVGELADLTEADLVAHHDPLWFVCSNGRRDVCCAERGRPVAAALAEHDAEATWETTHLGGHRFAATLLALPSGLTLGRLDEHTAVAAAVEIAAGRVPLEVTRGRAGWPEAAQVADLHLRREQGWTGLDDVGLVDGEGSPVHLTTPAGDARVSVGAHPGPALRASCDAEPKPTTRRRVLDVTMPG